MIIFRFRNHNSALLIVAQEDKAFEESVQARTRYRERLDMVRSFVHICLGVVLAWCDARHSLM